MSDTKIEVDKKESVRNSNKSTRQNKKLNLFGLFSCFLAIVAMVVAGYALWQQRSFSLLKNTQATYEQKLFDNTASLNSQQKKLGVLHQQNQDNAVLLQKLVKDLKQMQGSSNDTWLLAETEYLLRAANLQLQTNGDIKGAMHLLKQANGILNSINEYSLFSVRKGIEEDITALNGVEGVDITRLWLQLNASITQVQTLPIIAPEGFNVSTDNKEAIKTQPKNTTQDKLSWEHRIKQVLLDSWHFFSRQFHFNVHTDDKQVPLIAPKEEEQLKQNIQLMLTQAQQALLMHNETIYSQSLDNASRWIRLYFHNTSPEATALLAKIDYLKNTKIMPVLPKITNGLDALETYNAQRDGLEENKKDNIIKQNNEALPTKEPDNIATEKIEQSNPQPSNDEQKDTAIGQQNRKAEETAKEESSDSMSNKPKGDEGAISQ